MFLNEMYSQFFTIISNREKKPLQKAFSMQLVHQKYCTGKDLRSTGIKTSFSVLWILPNFKYQVMHTLYTGLMHYRLTEIEIKP